MTALGSNVRRKEDHRLVTGHGRFVTDVELPRMRHVAFLRSPFAHARITAVDAAGARDAGYRVFTGADFAGTVAAGAVRAAVLRRDRAAGAGARQGALRRGAGGRRRRGRPVPRRGRRRPRRGRLRAAAGDACARGTTRTSRCTPPRRTTCCSSGRSPRATWTRRSTTAHTVVDRELITNRHAGNPMECRAGVALFDDGRLTFWSGTQVPHLVRNMVAELLGLPEGDVRVIAPDVGGGFGVKAVLYPEDVALCLMARAMPGVPLKWTEDRAEHLLAATHARDHRYRMRAGVRRRRDAARRRRGRDLQRRRLLGVPVDGRDRAADGRRAADRARTSWSTTAAPCAASRRTRRRPARTAASPARRACSRWRRCSTRPPARSDMDPIEIRRRNVILPDDIPYRMPSKLVDDSGHYAECLDQAMDKLGYDAVRTEQQRRRGRRREPDRHRRRAATTS